MSPFTLLFVMALFSFAIHRLVLLKSLSIIVLAISLVLVYLGYATPLAGFATSEAISFFEAVVLLVVGAFILSEDDVITITQTLFIAAASFLLLESTTLISFILSFEVMSILSFVLVSNITSIKEAEGAIKMFIAGSIATAVLFFGVTLYLWSTQSLDTPLIVNVDSFGILGIWFMLGALFYKMTIVPMHTWSADSYAQVRPLYAALLSGVVKTVVFVATFKFFSPFILATDVFSTPIFIVLAVITMSLGNILALFQKNVTRILAYSSIAHAGYMLLGFVAVRSSYASVGVLYMAVAYIFMQSAVFILIDKLSRGVGDIKLEDLHGLVKKDKWSALFLSVQLFSLAGIPLLAGFLAKAVMVYAVVDAGYIIVALITLLNSALSVAYYAWIIKHIYFEENASDYTLEKLSFSSSATQVILLLGTLYFGVFASVVFSLTL